MAVNSRESLKQYCLRELGSPVVQINVADVQLEDRIDEALEYFRVYHSDGIEKVYLKHQITAQDMTNKYIEIPDMVYGVTRILPLTTGYNNTNIFSIQYQLRLHDLFDLTSTSMVYYNTAMEYLSTLNFVLNGLEAIRFNRYTNKLYIDVNWGSDIKEGDYIIVDCYRAIDMDANVRVWSDAWLKQYTTALFKRQWASNGKKFLGIQLPGAVTIDWQGMYDEAVGEIKELEDDLMNKSAPLSFFIG